MKTFLTPERTIGSLNAEVSASLLSAAADVALVIDADGVILDMAVQPADLALALEGFGRWLGKAWADTVTAGGRAKVDALLAEAKTAGTSGWRQLVHRTAGGRDAPILYCAVRLDENGTRIAALGRDMRAVSALQQRLVDAQVSMERDYAKLRFAETRYRLLFQASSEAVVVLDGTTHRVVEANPTAVALLERNGKRAVGRAFVELFDAPSRPRLQRFFGDLRGQSHADTPEATLADGTMVTLQATLFRQESSTLLLVQLQQAAMAGSQRRDGAEATLADFLRAAPDGIVIADGAGRVVDANATFLDMAQLPDLAAARGDLLENWFGRPGVDFDVFMANLRSHGAVRLFATTFRGTLGALIDVEVSAATLDGGKAVGKGNVYGFAIRDTGRRLPPPQRAATDLPRSAEQLTELIGRVPLKDLVRETTDVIEKLCIEAALELTNDNRASAAEVLGLSRQSLYVKLRRFGFADIGADGEP